MQEQIPTDITCALCKAPATKWLTSTNRGVGPKENFDIHRCALCSSTIINPIPLNLGIYYFHYHSIPTGQHWNRSVNACKKRLSVIHRHIGESASILDIGAGSGAFVAAATENGHLSFAIEQDEKCRKNIESFLPGRVVEDLSEYGKTSLSAPDVVTLWHVFEHIPNPGDFLEQICRFFPATTKVIIEVPNAESWMFKIMGNRWPHLDAPRHIFLPSMYGIEQIAQKNGMNVSRIRNSSNGAWGAFSISHFGMRAGEKRLIQIFRRLVQIFFTPFFLLEPIRHGTTNTYLLTRKS